MSPAHEEGLTHLQNDPAAHSELRPSGHVSRAMQRSITDAGPSSSRSVDSWIEISSQPSSSSLSSSVAGDEIVTTGLRVQQGSQPERRRRTLLPDTPLRLYLAEGAGGEGSSQDEYEESGSESDRILTSSNEGLVVPFSEANTIARRSPLSTTSADAEDEDEMDDEDEDESATALGVQGNQACFTPQPNAFSHPPSASRAPDSDFSSSATARPPIRSAPQRRPSSSARQQSSHSPLSVSSYHADHDAALRASLSTLLSCAAAARGLPKSYPNQRPAPASSNRVQPGTLRMIPQSALASSSPARTRSESASSAHSARLPGTGTTTNTKDGAKRKPPSRSTSKERAHAAKKLRAADATAEPVSPTLLTWVVSAGVLVLVSALSFGAGYNAGREAGRVEALGGPTPTVADACAREDLVGAGSTGLRRLRWSAGATAVAAGA